MKKGLVGALIIASSAVFAQNVPANVSTAFKAKFPKAEDTEWDVFNMNYEASFYEGDVSKTALFTKDGKFKESRTSIEEAPANVSKAVETKCKGALIDSITLIESADGSVKYEITASNDEDSYEVIADKEGKVLSSKVMTDEYDDE